MAAFFHDAGFRKVLHDRTGFSGFRCFIFHRNFRSLVFHCGFSCLFILRTGSGRDFRRMRDGDPYRHPIPLVGVAVRDKAFLCQSLMQDQFRLHTVGTCPCGGLVLRLAGHRIAVGVHEYGRLPACYGFLVAGHQSRQAFQFGKVVPIRDEKHVFPGHKPELVHAVGLQRLPVLCRKGHGEECEKRQ